MAKLQAILETQKELRRRQAETDATAYLDKTMAELDLRKKTARAQSRCHLKAAKRWLEREERRSSLHKTKQHAMRLMDLRHSYQFDIPMRAGIDALLPGTMKAECEELTIPRSPLRLPASTAQGSTVASLQSMRSKRLRDARRGEQPHHDTLLNEDEDDMSSVSAISVDGDSVGYTISSSDVLASPSRKRRALQVRCGKTLICSSPIGRKRGQQGGYPNQGNLYPRIGEHRGQRLSGDLSYRAHTTTHGPTLGGAEHTDFPRVSDVALALLRQANRASEETLYDPRRSPL